jgi:hypothetical protein
MEGEVCQENLCSFTLKQLLYFCACFPVSEISNQVDKKRLAGVVGNQLIPLLEDKPYTRA